MLEEFCDYAITNKKSGNALDLSGVDCVSIVGYPYHGRDNQKWTSMPKDHCWALLNKTSGGCLNSDGEPRDGAKMIGTPSPMFFVIMLAVDHEPDHYRIFLPRSDLYITLSGVDSNDPVELRHETGGEDQVWKFQQV